jgi:phosphate transport system substrate-binding protein
MRYVIILCIVTLGIVACSVPATRSGDQLPEVAPAPAIQPTVARTHPPLTPPPDLPNTAPGPIIIDGSSTVFPISEAAALAFRQFAPQVDIRLGVSGTGGGFAKFCAGETLISGASRPIKPAEAALCAAAEIAFVELPIAFDGLSLVVHAQNDWATCLTTAELQQIWMPEAEGSLVRWNQVRPEWPDAPLDLYGAGGDSGTYDYFTEAIIGATAQSRQDYVASEDDYLIAQDVAENIHGLGFFGYAYYVEYADRLHAVAVDAGEGCVLPTEESIATGRYQPLSRPIFIYVRADALSQPEVAAFVTFYVQNGPALVTQARYIPLPPVAYIQGVNRIERKLTGTAFPQGAPTRVSLDDLFSLER